MNVDTRYRQELIADLKAEQKTQGAPDAAVAAALVLESKYGLYDDPVLSPATLIELSTLVIQDHLLSLVQNPKALWNLFRKSLPDDLQDAGGGWHSPSLRCDGCQDTYDHWDGK